jgi:hypothetical protein
MATAKQPKYLRKARRMLTVPEQAELPHLVLRQGGMFTSRRVRPRFWVSIGKVLAIVGLTGFCGLFIVSGTLTDSLAVLAGGIPGHVTVDGCHRSSRSATCHGMFVADDRAHPVVIDDAVIEGGGRLPVGSTVAARAGTADANHVYLGWSLVPLIPLVVFGAGLLLLVTLLVAWPLRAAIHLWRPDVWPYWVGPATESLMGERAPRPVRIAIRVAVGYLAVLAVAFVLAMASGIGGPYGLGVGVLLAVAWLIRRIVRERSARRP